MQIAKVRGSMAVKKRRSLLELHETSSTANGNASMIDQNGRNSLRRSATAFNGGGGINDSEMAPSHASVHYLVSPTS